METTVKNNVNGEMEKKINMDLNIEVPESIEKFGGTKITIKIDALYKASEKCLQAEQEFQEKMLNSIFQIAQELSTKERQRQRKINNSIRHHRCFNKNKK